MEKSNDSTLKFCSTPTVDGCRAESLPDDVLTVNKTFPTSSCYPDSNLKNLLLKIVIEETLYKR
jgi:hypothetical protein